MEIELDRLIQSWNCSILSVDYGGVCTKFAVPETILRDINTDFTTLNNLEDDVSAKYIDEITSNPSEEGISRNTGFVTFSHQGTVVPEIVSKLSFLHEIGHSLGSPVSIIFIPHLNFWNVSNHLLF